MMVSHVVMSAYLATAWRIERLVLEAKTREHLAFSARVEKTLADSKAASERAYEAIRKAEEAVRRSEELDRKRRD